jgi:hypothetical protein
MNERTAKEVVEEMYRRQYSGDPTVLDDLVACSWLGTASSRSGRIGAGATDRSAGSSCEPGTAVVDHCRPARATDN